MRDKITCWFHSFCGSFHLHSNRRIRPHFFHSLFWFHSKKAFYLTANHEESKQEGIENGKNCENLIFCQFHYLFLILTKNRLRHHDFVVLQYFATNSKIFICDHRHYRKFEAYNIWQKGHKKQIPKFVIVTTMEKLYFYFIVCCCKLEKNSNISCY